MHAARVSGHHWFPTSALRPSAGALCTCRRCCGVLSPVPVCAPLPHLLLKQRRLHVKKKKNFVRKCLRNTARNTTPRSLLQKNEAVLQQVSAIRRLLPLRVEVCICHCLAQVLRGAQSGYLHRADPPLAFHSCHCLSQSGLGFSPFPKSLTTGTGNAAFL